MSHHRRFPPSSASRWLACTASVQAIGDIPEGETSYYAAEGTVAHALLENVIKVRDLGVLCTSPPGDVVGLEGYSIEITQEMHDGVRDAWEYIEGVAMGGSYVMLAETRVDRKAGDEQLFGMVDCLIYKPAEKRLHVLDFKYGKGVAVHANGNDQLAMYGAMALDSMDFMFDEIADVELHIMQPRVREGFSSWVRPVADLERYWAKWVTGQVEEALGGDAVFAPDESTCRWCPVSGNCDAQATKLAEAFDDLGTLFPDIGIGTLTDDQLVALYRELPFFEQTIKALREQMVTRLEAGCTLEGYKLVESRTNMRWVDDHETVAAKLVDMGLGNNVWKRTIITPAQARDALPEGAILPETVRPPGKPAVARADDPRPQYQVAEEFNILE